ncbi:hypothetical protein WN944_010522 [Citrus x changshan-huyou]|uniref:Bifunctional inhibitor/plant lipid transfer protein/seed storage helical domain-containing protein n=1 Tax=Citrus x changshan-huyou TaxID=2935761 RepID=A0AAP0MRS4_9ROSI
MARHLLYLATIALMLVSVSKASESSFCDNVFNNFIHCVRYVSDLSINEPASGCCSGIINLKQVANQNEAGPAQICQCIEDLARVMHIPFDASRIQSLRIHCHTHLSFPISNAMDCSK